MTYDTKSIHILLLIIISITGTSCAPYDYDKIPQKRIGIEQGMAIYTTDGRESVKRDTHAEHHGNLSCSANNGRMDCGREIGW